MSARTDLKDFIDFFGRAIGVTHGTYSTVITLPDPINLLQIQFDCATTSSNSSFRISRSGSRIKTGAFTAGPGTREVNWYGRALSCPEGVVLTRNSADSHQLFWTLIYTRKP